MNEATKDLDHFKEQVAKREGYNTWIQLDAVEPQSNSYPLLEEAAEAYALYRYEQGKQEVESMALSEFMLGYVGGQKQYELKGWNEALHWAAEETQIDFVVGNDLKQSILNGLKEE